MVFETKRLVLRPWREDDAESLYEYAKDPRVGPIAGWSVHTSVENSRQCIKEVLSVEDTYAVTLKEDDRAIGSISLLFGEKSNLDIAGDEAEIGYWLGVPFWGNAYIPEAINELMNYAFETCNVPTLWCGYFDGNEKSKRAQEKCGFTFHHTEWDKPWPLMNDIRTEHITCITKEQWKFKQLFDLLGDHQIMCLATEMGHRVTARSMSVIIYERKFYIQTDQEFTKYTQMMGNPKVALCLNNIQIEGSCKEMGHPFEEGNAFFTNKFKNYYRGSFDAYSHYEKERVIEITPTQISIWDYEEGKPYQEFFDIDNGTYRKSYYKAKGETLWD